MNGEHSSRVDNAIFYLFRKTWQYSADNRRNVVLYCCMFVIANSITLIFPPLIVVRIMDIIQKQGVTLSNSKYLYGLLVLTLLCDILFWGFHGPARLMENVNGFRVRLNYKEYLLKGVLTLPLEWHTDHHSGDTIDKIEKGTSGLYAFATGSFMVIYAFVQLCISYGMLVYFSPPAAYIVLGMVLVTIWIMVRFDKKIVGQYTELNLAENRISESVFDAISNIVTVVILRVERLVFKAVMHKVEKPFELFCQNNRINELKWFLVNICCNVMTNAVLGVYIWQNVGTAPGMVFTGAYILTRYLEKVSDTFYTFARMYGDILQQKARVMNAEELSKDFLLTANFTNHVLPRDWHTLEVRDLNFSYHSNGDELHLGNVAFSFVRGERIALIGESGSGKTTLLKVMRDLYHPQTLQLAVNGNSIADGFAGISRAIALVPQSPEIFATTIWENLTWGAREHTHDSVRRFTDMACVTDVIEVLPRKFDTSVKEKGVIFSEGQKQRIALARGLLACADKDIVLLDEPTSSLDTAHEMRIYQNIFRAFNDKTIISSIHRLHLLPLFHRIYMFSGGRIIASGTLDELLSHCAEFQELWRQYTIRQTEIAEI